MKKSPRGEHGGAAGDIVGHVMDESPTSRQGTSRRRRRGAVARRAKDMTSTPQGPPKRHLGGSAGGYPYMPMPYTQPNHE